MKKIILSFVILTISNFAFAQFPNLVASSNSPICQSNTLSLSATHDALLGGTTATYNWAGPSGFTSAVQNPQRPNAYIVDGTYTVTLTLSGTQTGTYTATTSVLTNTSPIANVTSYLQGDNLNSSLNFCAGNNITLEAVTDYSSGVSYSWTGPNGFTSTLQTPTIANVTAANAGIYQATFTFNNSSCVFVIKRNYEITIGSPRVATTQNQVCYGGNVTLSPVLQPATATVSSYLWEGPNGFTSNASSLTINNLQERRAYKLTTVFGGGCSGTSIVYPVVNPMVPTPTVTANLLNCNASVVASMPTTFSPATLTNYSWTGPGGFTSNQLTAQVTQAGEYIFTGTISGAGCNDVFTRTLTVPRIPSTTSPIFTSTLLSTNEFGASQTSYCDGNNVLLTATKGGEQFQSLTYSWTGPNGFSSTLAIPTITNFGAAKAGVYNVVITGTGNACSPTATATTSNTIFIGHNAAPSLTGITFSNANAAGTAFCSGNTVSMTPILNSANSSNTFGFATYSWTGPNGFSSTQRVPRISNVSAADEGVYSLTATFSGGCVGTATTSARLTLSTQSTFSVTSRKIKFNNATGIANCLGSTVELIAQTGGSIINSISWTGPNGFASTALSPQIVNASAANSGYYYATIDMGGECPATITRAANLNFTSSALPFSILRINTDPASDNRSVCTGNNIKLYPNPFANDYQATYSWAGPNGFTSNAISPTISNIDASKLGVYTLNVNYTDGCTGTASTSVTINTNPPTISIGTAGANSFCNGFPVTLAVTNTNNLDVISWAGPNGFTSNQSRVVIPSFSASSVGIYTVTVNVSGSCPTTVTATANITYETAPVTTTIRFTEQITSLAANNQCAGSNIILSLPSLVASQITSYSWSGPGGFSSNLASPTVTNAAAGTYTVTVGYLVCGVISTVTATATLTNTKSLTLLARSQGGANGTSFCAGSNVELFVAATNPTYAQPNSYSWAGPNGFSSTAAVPLISNVAAANGGIYTLTVNFGGLCAGTVTATISITVASYQANLFARRPGQSSNAFTFCSGSAVELYSSNTPSSGTITSYNWTGPSGFSSTATLPQIASFQAANAGTYSLTVIVSGGACAGTYTATTSLLVGNPVHSIIINTSTVLCTGGNTALLSTVSNQSYGTGTTYSWTAPNSFNSTSANVSLTNLQAVNSGVYSVAINYPNTSGCAASGSVTSTIKLAIGNTAANILAGQDQTVNANTSFPLNFELLGGTFPITITLSNGASFVLSGVNANSGNFVTLNTSVSSSQTLSISSITSSCGAGTGTGSAVITANIPCPTTSTALSRLQGAGTPSTSFCTGSNVELYATFNSNPAGATYSYNWTGPNGFSSTSDIPLLSNAQTNNSGTYTLTVTFGGSCTGTASSTRTISVANLNLNAVARRTGQSNAYSFCAGTTVELFTLFNPSNPTVSSYSWTGPNGFSSTDALPQIASFQAVNAGTYTLSAVVSGTCAGTYTASLPLSLSNTVSPSIALSGTSVQCPGGNLTFFALPITGNFSSGSTYSWSGPNNFSSTAANPVINNLQAVNSGTYTVTVVYPATTGCASFSGTSTMTTKLSIGNTAANILPNQNQTVASGVNFPLNIEILGGTLPISMTLSNGSSFTVSNTNGNTGNIYTANTSVTTAQTITISSITSSCGVGTGTGSAVITLGTPCPPSLPNYSATINNTVVQYKEASGDITTQSVTINSGGKLTLDSGKSILLQPGFEAKSGSVFRAFIDGCGNITN